METISVDVLIIALNEIQYDARLHNFIRTFQHKGLKIAAVSLDKSNDYFQNLYFFPISLEDVSRTISKTIKFTAAGLKLLNKLCPSVVVCSDVYSLILGYFFKRRYNSRLIYDSREIYSALASLSKHRAKQFILKEYERLFVKFVDKIVVTGVMDKDYLGKIFPRKEIVVIKNFPPKQDNTKKLDLRKELKLPDESILAIYQGVLLEGRGLPLAIQSLQYAQMLHLLIAGSGQLEQRLRILANELSVADRVHFLGKIPYPALMEITRSCDVGLCLVEPVSFSYELALPNKLFEYIQSRIPVVATNLPQIERIFEEYEVGELVPKDITAEFLAQKILEVARNKEKFSEILDKCSSVFVWEKQENEVLGLLR